MSSPPTRAIAVTALAFVGCMTTPLDLDFAACDAPATCTLAPRGCCGVCGTPTLHDVVAVARAHAADYRHVVCGDPVPACAPCPAITPEANLDAVCRDGECTAIDLRTDRLSRCQSDADCRLRYAACCECGLAGAALLVAIRVDAVAEYASDLCAPDAACAKCLPLYPTDRRAACDRAAGHCAVVAAP